MGVGGAARWFLPLTRAEELPPALEWATSEGLPWFILGGGSNLLVADEGIAGLVIHMAIRGMDATREGDHMLVSLGAGECWDDFVAVAAARDWAGVTCLSGIPGSVGAAPIQNIGAYGQEIAETLEQVEAWDTRVGRFVVLKAADCAFAYRDSLFKSGEPNRYIVTRVVLRLKIGGRPKPRYPDLMERLAAGADLEAVRRTVLEIRRAKSMVFDPADANSHGCGSFFTNPIIDEAAYARFKDKVAGPHPHYPAGPGRVKLAAAWLIEQSGFSRGYGEGPIGLSEKHCLAIVNRGGGSSEQVRCLARHIQEKVFDVFGIELEPEPRILDGLGRVRPIQA